MRRFLLMLLLVPFLAAQQPEPRQYILSYDDAISAWRWATLGPGIQFAVNPNTGEVQFTVDAGNLDARVASLEAVTAQLQNQISQQAAQIAAQQTEIATLQQRVDTLEQNQIPLPPATQINVVQPPVTPAAIAAVDAAALQDGFVPVSSCTLPSSPPTQIVPVGFGWEGLPQNPEFRARCGGSSGCEVGKTYYWASFGHDTIPRDITSTSTCIDNITVASAAQIRYYVMAQ